MGDADQTPFELDFFQPAEHESTEAHIVFDVAEDGFVFNTSLFSQGDALLGEQIVPGLLAIMLQFEAELHAPYDYLHVFGSENSRRTVLLPLSWMELIISPANTLYNFVIQA